MIFDDYSLTAVQREQMARLITSIPADLDRVAREHPDMLFNRAAYVLLMETWTALGLSDVYRCPEFERYRHALETEVIARYRVVKRGSGREVQSGDRVSGGPYGGRAVFVGICCPVNPQTVVLAHVPLHDPSVRLVVNAREHGLRIIPRVFL